MYHCARSIILIGAVHNAIERPYSPSPINDVIPKFWKNGTNVFGHHIALNILIAGILRDQANAVLRGIDHLKLPSALLGIYPLKFVFVSLILLSNPSGYDIIP